MRVLGGNRASRARGKAGFGRLLVGFALLALLANQAALPVVHFASGWSFAGAGAGYDHCGDPAQNSPQADHHGQACHFCRLISAALPPPSCLPIGRLAPPGAVAWVSDDSAIRPAMQFRAGCLPRAPPRMA
jgi:hypothetical protein